MKTDSDTTRSQKKAIREQVEVAFLIHLPDWFLEGVTVHDLRELQRIFHLAHERLMSEGTIPTKDERRCKHCGRPVVGGKTHWIVPDGVAPGNAFFCEKSPSREHEVGS
jgi:hypothetical protein